MSNPLCPLPSYRLPIILAKESRKMTNFTPRVTQASKQKWMGCACTFYIIYAHFYLESLGVWTRSPWAICALAFNHWKVTPRDNVILKISDGAPIQDGWSDEYDHNRNYYFSITIRHKRDLWTFIERSLRIKKDILRHLVKTESMWVDQVKFELKCTPRYLTVCSRDNASPLMRESGSWGKCFWDKRGIPHITSCLWKVRGQHSRSQDDGGQSYI